MESGRRTARYRLAIDTDAAAIRTLKRCRTRTGAEYEHRICRRSYAAAAVAAATVLRCLIQYGLNRCGTGHGRLMEEVLMRLM